MIRFLRRAAELYALGWFAGVGFITGALMLMEFFK